MNHIALIGNLGQDPEINWRNYKDSNGEEQALCTCSFSITVPEWSKKEKKEIPNWIKCKATGKTAENIGEYFKKGSKIAVEGRIKTDTWKNEANENRSTTYVQVSSFNFLTKKSDSDQSSDEDNHSEQPKSGSKSAPKKAEYSDEIGEDEIPF